MPDLHDAVGRSAACWTPGLQQGSMTAFAPPLECGDRLLDRPQTEPYNGPGP